MSKELLLDAGWIISAGGTSKRRDELISKGLNPNCMIAYTNRFADLTVKAQYRLDNFAKVQDCMLMEIHFPERMKVMMKKLELEFPSLQLVLRQRTINQTQRSLLWQSIASYLVIYLI
jgi:hypothetical protein